MPVSQSWTSTTLGASVHRGPRASGRGPVSGMSDGADEFAVNLPNSRDRSLPRKGLDALTAPTNQMMPKRFVAEHARHRIGDRARVGRIDHERGITHDLRQ